LFYGDEDVDSQDFSDTSSDAEGVFAFGPPSTAEQRSAPEHPQNEKRLSGSPHYHFSPRSEDAHTLVETPVPLAAVLAGPSRFTSQIPVDPHIGQYKYAAQHTAEASRPSSRASHRKTNSDVRIAFSDSVVIREKEVAKSIVTDASESVIGFEFDDSESRDGSKEYVFTSSANSLSLTVLQM
jgi:hypothetical protein